jgi:CxxC motif-containing protein (DUF1111 family)
MLAAAITIAALIPPTALAQDNLNATLGRALFERPWVTAPSSTKAADGLGPLYNARSCASCHPASGRGHPSLATDPEDRGTGFVLRLADDPIYGRQLQALGTAGQTPEGRLTVTYTDEKLLYPDGSITILRRPTYGIADPGYGPVAGTLGTSARLAPALHGLGLLERIPDADILAQEDPDDHNGDGISGRANRLSEGDSPAIGRFGWKATHATISHQNAEAFSLDIGMSTPLFPAPWGDCTETQSACRTARHGDQPQYEGLEIPSTLLNLLDDYIRSLPPPSTERPPVAAQESLFAATGCAACHRPSFGTVRPYTDLLLHDLGDGLADSVPGGQATGREWRTAPLWGLGRTVAAADGALALLHDGRARSVAEAILWHGGEAQDARRRFMSLPHADRQRLIQFILSL